MAGTGQHERALPLLNRALAADPGSVDILSSVAEADRATGRPDAAMRAVESIVRANDADPGDVLPFAADALASGDPREPSGWRSWRRLDGRIRRQPTRSSAWR